uniref:Sensor protein FixL n=1 Tax=Magnetococcus massalia (strain MO-1) TaxID=451514 RepID=A0A1S7LIR6_MAGMO|nr:Putative histidine kinase with one CHASE domain, two PAS domains, one HisKA domain and HATPase c domain [Candidatus Magnetococcus massalia]
MDKKHFVHSVWLTPLVLSTILLGVVLSLVGFQVAHQIELQKERVEFQRVAGNYVSALRREIETNLEVLLSIDGFYRGSAHVDRQEFAQFVQRSLLRHPTLQALEWIPKVSHAERQRYEEAARRDGMTDYQIRERSREGEMVAASRRDTYFPVYYVEPMQGNEMALGFDLASSAARLKALNQARDSGKLTATGRITLVQDSSKQAGFLVFFPIFSGPSHTPTQRYANLQGFALAVYRINTMVETSLKHIDTSRFDLQIQLYDVTNEPESFLYQPMESSDLDDLRRLSKQQFQDYSDTIPMAGRLWRVDLFPSMENLHNHTHTWFAWMVLVSGLIITYLLAMQLKQRALELSENREQTRAIVRTVVNGIITADSEGVILTFNPAAELMFGYKEREVIGRNLSMLMPEPNRSAHDGYLQHHIQTGDKRLIGIGREVYALKKSGDVFPIWLAVDVARVKGKKIFVGCLVDISQRKEAEQEIKKLSLAIKQSPNVVVITDVEGTIEYVNPAFEAVTGYSSAEAVGQNPRLLKSPDTSGEVHKALWQTITLGNVWRGEMKNRCKDGSHYWALLAIFPVRDDSGEIIHFIGLQEDISARKGNEKLLLEAKEAAESANRAKSEFLNVMSHELRTPLTVVLGSLPFISQLGGLALVPGEKTLPSVKKLSEVLAQESLERGEVKEACLGVMGQLSGIAVKMQNQGEHLRTLINDLLDISKIEAGKMELDREMLSAQVVVDDVVHGFQTKAQEMGLQLSYACSDGIQLYADPVRLKQVLINLVGNALKFTDQGQVAVVVEPHGEQVLFRVRDTGCGIPQALLDSVFDNFTQTDSSATRKAGGTGLGLAITKRLVNLHGGVISVESVEGQGSTFTFTMPRSDPDKEGE